MTSKLLCYKLKTLSGDYFQAGWKTGRPSTKSVKRRIEALERRLNNPVVILALDVGQTTGFVVVNKNGVIGGYLEGGEGAIVPLIRMVDEYACRSRKYLVVLIEGGYCPSYLPIFLSGVAYGAAMLATMLWEVRIIPPHLKPPEAKEKSVKTRIQYFLEALRKDLNAPAELPTPYGHTASAFGLVQRYLKEVEDALSYKSSAEIDNFDGECVS